MSVTTHLFLCLPSVFSSCVKGLQRRITVTIVHESGGDMEWKEVRELVVGKFWFLTLKTKLFTNSGHELVLRHLCFLRTSPQHPWIWWDHRRPQYSLSQHLVCWVRQAYARRQVRTAENIWKLITGAHASFICSLTLVNSKLEISIT